MCVCERERASERERDRESKCTSPQILSTRTHALRPPRTRCVRDIDMDIDMDIDLDIDIDTNMDIKQIEQTLK